MAPRHGASRARRKRRDDLKDRLIQTRVPESLESTLKEEAQKRRLSVSHLIRNVLEDAFDLVDTVVSGAERLAGDSVQIAGQVAEDATRIAASVRGARDEVREAMRSEGAGNAPGSSRAAHAPAPVGTAASAAGEPTRSPVRRAVPEDVLGFQPLVVYKPTQCFSCGVALPRGASGHLAVTSTPGLPPLWLCAECLSAQPAP